MELMQFINDLADTFRYEISIVFFIFFIFYVTNKNEKNFEKMIARKDDIKIKFEKQRKDIYKLYAKGNDDLTQYYRSLDDLEKNFSNDIREVQSDFDSRSLLNIENCIIISAFLIVIISLLYFKG